MPNPDPATLTGWPLSVKCAMLSGWEDLLEIDGVWMGAGSRYWSQRRPVPAYHESLNACFRDLVPVLAAKGWDLSLNTTPLFSATDSRRWYRVQFERFPEAIKAEGATPAEAICRAFLLVMANEENDDRTGS